jgi:integrase
MVLVAGYTGLRWGELTGLRARRVEPLRGRIEVVVAVTEVDGVMVFGTPKTHQHRSVVVPRFLREGLGLHVAAKAPADLVFASRTGTPLRVQNFRRDWFGRAAEAVGVPGLTPHELRHTAASLAIASGASIKGVQSMLGHASAQMTLDRYGHLFQDELEAVADRLDAARADQVLTKRLPTDPVTPIRRSR